MALFLCGFLVVACQGAAPTGSPAAGQLPTWDPGPFCPIAELLPATVRVDPGADPPTWIVSPRTNLEWPVGFRLQVTNGVGEVVDPDGTVVVRDGGQLVGAFGGASARGGSWFAVCGIGSRYYTTSTRP
jgi:hypothetical protein